MTLDTALIAEINTPVTGANGQNASGPVGPPPGSPGFTGDPGMAGTLTVAGDSFSDPSASLYLHPSVTGGTGGWGSIGYGGKSGVEAISYTVTSGITTEIQSFSGGNAGGVGGFGGASGLANLVFSGDTVGASGAFLGGASTIDSTAAGGNGGEGAPGGNGGAAGRNWYYYDNSPFPTGPAVPDIISQGAIGGQGGAGQVGSTGGDAANSVTDLQEFVTGAAIITLNATGGDGGSGGIGGPGSIGAEASAGNGGGAGGAGGQATADLSGSAIADAKAITVNLTATGGSGGTGGGGGNAGVGVDHGAGGYNIGSTYFPFTLTDAYGPSGNGGAGGAAGSAIADVTNTTFSSPSITLTLSADAGVIGFGGQPGSPGASPGQTVLPDGDITNVLISALATKGSTGATGAGQLSFTGNTVIAANALALTLHVVDDFGRLVPLDGAAGGNLAFSGNSFTGSGTAELDVSGSGSGATIDDLHGSIAIAGSPANAMTGFDTYILGNGDVFVRGTSPVATIFVAPDPDTIVFSPGHGATSLDQTTETNTILDFQGYGATLTLAQLTADTSQQSGNTLINIPGDGVVTLVSDSWMPTASNTNLACFRAGTRIATPAGETAVEKLAIGDFLLTLAGARRAIAWIGRRRVVCRNHPRVEKILPIRIAAGAFGAGRPHRDLWLSPDHAVFIEQVLIPIRLLVNGTTIARVAADTVTYYHVELASHDVVLAEGLPTETYLDTANRDCFETAGGALRLHPDFEPAAAWEAAGCAPLVVVGPELDRARDRLAQIAAETFPARPRFPPITATGGKNVT